MSTKHSLTLKDYYAKVQEAADEIARDRNEEKIQVVPYPASELRRGIRACVTESSKLCLPILEEAFARVDEKYELKAEDELL